MCVGEVATHAIMALARFNFAVMWQGVTHQHTSVMARVQCNPSDPCPETCERGAVLQHTSMLMRARGNFAADKRRKVATYTREV